MTGSDRTEPPDEPDGRGAPAGQGVPAAPRIPTPRSSVEDTGLPLPDPRPAPLALEHPVLKSLLGAWALAACSAEEATAVEEHMGECGPCAEEALRLRDAVGLLHPEESLDLDPRAAHPCPAELPRPPPAAHPGPRVGRAVRRRRAPASTPCSGTSATPSGTPRCGCAGSRRAAR
ncbi:hypothetical protein SALBM135S_05387 [Streptomyces alboniger]